jgi:hypothetical protein
MLPNEQLEFLATNLTGVSFASGGWQLKLLEGLVVLLSHDIY